MEKELQDHPDREFVEYLLKGLREGFDTEIENAPQNSYECRNLLSARSDPECVRDLIHKELEKGYIRGPFDYPPFPLYRVSPLGVATGKYSGKKRLIVDLSSPHDDPVNPSLNDLIDKDKCSLKYVKIDDAIEIIKKLGKGAWLCKADITDAFKLMPIHPRLWHLHCIKFDDKYYFFTRLCFGSRSSPKIFDKLSQAVCWIAQNNYGIEHILHLLDDFLTVDAPSADADRTMALLTHIFKILGIPTAPHKTIGPEQSLEYLGVILDTILMQARLPEEKVLRITSLVESVQDRRSVTKRELLVLLGHFNFASRVIIPGRSFVSYLIKLSTTVTQLHHHVTIDAGCRKDLAAWAVFLRQWNGVSIFLESQLTKAADYNLFTDSSGTIGYGGYFQGRWFLGKWPKQLDLKLNSELSMAYLELFPIVVAALLWGHEWKGKRILFNCDNMATVNIIQKGRSKSLKIMELMRVLTMTAAKIGFTVYAKYLNTKKNDIADALSRFQLQRFHQLAPSAEPLPCKIPVEMIKTLTT